MFEGQTRPLPCVLRSPALALLLLYIRRGLEHRRLPWLMLIVMESAYAKPLAAPSTTGPAAMSFN